LGALKKTINYACFYYTALVYCIYIKKHNGGNTLVNGIDFGDWESTKIGAIFMLCIYYKGTDICLKEKMFGKNGNPHYHQKSFV